VESIRPFESIEYGSRVLTNLIWVYIYDFISISNIVVMVRLWLSLMCWLLIRRLNGVAGIAGIAWNNSAGNDVSGGILDWLLDILNWLLNILDLLLDWLNILDLLLDWLNILDYWLLDWLLDILNLLLNWLNILDWLLLGVNGGYVLKRLISLRHNIPLSLDICQLERILRNIGYKNIPVYFS